MNIFEEKSTRSYNRKAEIYEDPFDGKFTKNYKKKLMEFKNFYIIVNMSKQAII